VILGYAGCGYYDRAVKAANEVGAECWPTKFATREQFIKHISKPELKAILRAHKSSPVVFELAVVPSRPAARTSQNVLDADTLSDAAFIGGCDDLLKRLKLSLLDNGPPSRTPTEVFKYFERMQSSYTFVLYVLWRGAW